MDDSDEALVDAMIDTTRDVAACVIARVSANAKVDRARNARSALLDRLATLRRERDEARAELKEDRLGRVERTTAAGERLAMAASAACASPAGIEDWDAVSAALDAWDRRDGVSDA